MFSFNNIEENFSKNHLQPFDQFSQFYRARSISESMSSMDPNLLGGYHDDKSLASNNPTLSKTFRTIRKHLTRTSNNESDLHNLSEEFHSNFPKQTITTVTIKRSIPADKTISSFQNEFKTESSNDPLHGAYSFEYMKDKFPKQKSYQNDDIYHQSTANKQALSTTYTTYHTRTVTVHSNSGALI